MNRHPRRWWILAVLCLCVWILVMDNTVLNLAAPVIMDELGARSDDIQWIINAYALAFAGLLLTAGSLSDRYGRRRLLVLGMTVFGLASVAASLAAEPWHLVGARALMGVGAAMLMPSTLSILVGVFDEDERRKAFAAWSAAAMFGLIIGPLIGGAILETAHWGAIFLVNVPVAVLSIAVVLVLVPESKGPARRLDPVGVALSTTGMVALVYCVVSVPHTGWSALPVRLALGLAVVTLVGFALWERRVPHPLLPMALLRNPRFVGASLTVGLVVFGSGALLLVLSQYLQFVRGSGPMDSGVALMPYVAASVAGNVVGGALGKRGSNQALIGVGFGGMSLGFVLLGFLDGSGGSWFLVSGLVTMGFGAGLAGPAANAMLMGAVPGEHAGVGSALNDTVQQVGMALSVAVLGSALAWKYTAAMPASAPEAARESIAGALALGDPALAAAAKAAFIPGMTLTLVTGAACCVVAVLLAFGVLRVRAAE
ncbi:MFS transporter [Nonomuraea sp. NBC_01738]|uniref:MFS transporter n=1 Tax=Nonomuraea sp. NBC_01738 TaxID=2976003 RepID=UPI002E0FC7D0|nr:MFS transporter [Nonomuraea sp. NBC_01738]